jgi:hypothetical protein
MTTKLCDRAGIGTRTARAAAPLAAFAAIMACPAPAAAQVPPYFNQGLRWIGMRPASAPACVPVPGWTTGPVFSGITLGPSLARLCLYVWDPGGTPPTPAQIATLFAVSGATELVEDVPVVFPAAYSSEEIALFTGLRDALQSQVGTAALLPSMPTVPPVRVVVIDTAPDATAGNIHPGTSRHGDTLAHLIEDIVCHTSGGTRRCAAEVTTALALQRREAGIPVPNGGTVGTLSDLARAIARAVKRWQDDRHSAPSTTPARLVLNLSLGWEDLRDVADCNTAMTATLKPPARAVRGILEYATEVGALVIAAAGNDAGGPTLRAGLVCPARFQAVPQPADPSQSLVIAASGVDYQDRALEVARPLAVTAIAALGVGGFAWSAPDPAPPALTGSSVSTAVISAIAALVWGAQPTWRSGQVISAIYNGSTVEVAPAHPSNHCPRTIPGCVSRRASVCGALRASGVPTSCIIPPARAWSCPALPAQVAALNAAFAGGPRLIGTPVSVTSTARYTAPSMQVAPWTFPAPISGTCTTCYADSSIAGSEIFVITQLDQDLQNAALVAEQNSNGQDALSLGNLTRSGTPYVFQLPPQWRIRSSYVTGLDQNGNSVTEQIFVHR